jgi:tRNA G18 (ribose-2'-O)-methylase SpoU
MSDDANDERSLPTDPQLKIIDEGEITSTHDGSYLHPDDPHPPANNHNKRKTAEHFVNGKIVREEKRRKWEAKRQKRRHSPEIVEENDRTVWLQNHSHIAYEVVETDIDTIVDHCNTVTAPILKDPVDTLSVNKIPHDLAIHLLPYFNIQEPQRLRASKLPSSSSSSSSSETLFIAEGTETIRILIQQLVSRSSTTSSTYSSDSDSSSFMMREPDGQQPLSSVQLKSIFVKPNLLFDPPVSLLTDVHRAWNELHRTNGSSVDGHRAHAGGGSPTQGLFRVMVGSESVLSKVAGFRIARGALACGVVPTDRTEEWLDERLSRLLGGHTQGTDDPTMPPPTRTRPVRLLALDGVCDNANLGTMIRTASAFGMDAIVLSHDTCDAWYRRVIRVSMGHVFVKPIVRVQNLAAFLAKWGQPNDGGGLTAGLTAITSYAAVIDRSEDVLVLDKLSRGDIPNAWCCVMGNEGRGISEEVVKQCTNRIRIDMALGVDSLSVPIACGILLHGLREREKGS